MIAQGRPGLPLVSAPQQDDPRNAIQIILQGLQPPTGARGPYMPGFADALTDAQIAEIVDYMRSRYSDRPAWPGLPSAVAEARKEGSQP